MITYDGKAYAINIDKLFNYTLTSDTSSITAKDIEVTDGYEVSGKQGKNGENTPSTNPVTKVVRETKTYGNSEISNFKYDLLKTFVVTLLSYNEDNNMNDGSTPSDFAVSIAFNTLLKSGFLYEINN